METTVLLYTSKNTWVIGKTLKEAKENAKYKRGDLVMIYVFSCTLNEITVDTVLGGYISNFEPLLITDGFEKL